VDTLLGEVIPAELLKQWVLEEVVQWRERLYGPLTTLVLFIEQVMSVGVTVVRRRSHGVSVRAWWRGEQRAVRTPVRTVRRERACR
jgi:hypothetical protein